MKTIFRTDCILVHLALLICVGLVSGCLTTYIPQIIQPTPNFSWEPPSKDKPQNLTIALVRPDFGGDSKFEPSRYSNYSKSKNPHLKTFLDSLQTDLQRTLIAKGFTVTGPYESFDVMTFPNKKDAVLALIPEFVLVVDEKYANANQSPDGHLTQLNGSLTVNGFVKFTMVEPISEQKIWIKKINVPEQTEAIDVDILITDGQLNPFHPNKDNRAAAFVNVLNSVYPDVMQKFWSYLNAEEIEMMRKASTDARARKGF